MSIIASLNFAWVSSYVIKETEVIREKIKTQSSILIVIDSVSYQVTFRAEKVKENQGFQLGVNRG